MQIQGISAVTNPFQVKRNQPQAQENTQQQQPKREQLPADMLVRTEDGRWVSKSINPQTGDVMINV